MSFPSTPVNGQTATVNNIVYTYNSTNSTWTRSGATGNVTTTGNLTASGIVITNGIYWSNGAGWSGNMVSTGSGNVTINNNAINLTPVGPGATTVGGSTSIPVITTDLYGRVTALGSVSISIPSSTITLSGTSGSGSINTGSTLTFAGSNGVTATASGSTITIGTPQDLRTSASPTFAALTVSGTITAGNINATVNGISSNAISVTGATQSAITTLPGLTSLGASGVTTTAAGNFTITGNLNVQGSTNTINNTIVETTQYVSTIDAVTIRAATLGNTGAAHIGNQATFGNITTTNGIFWSNGSAYSSSSFKYTAAATVPSSPNLGDQWYNTSTNILYEYINDGANTIWIDVSTPIVSAVYSNITSDLIPVSNVAVNIGSSTNWFNNIYGTAIHAQYADLAENYASDARYAPGTVVVFGGTAEITKSTQSHDAAVAGVISTNPAYVMNSEMASGLPVALTGRVPCLVLGPVRRGDRLATSEVPGTAGLLINTQWQPGVMIGKSLEDHLENTVKLIEISLGRG
jgi:hypothetical protein